MTKTTVHDPVCGMQVRPTADALRAQHDDTTYYFCSSACRQRFVDEPSAFLAHDSGQPSRQTNPEAIAIYTCPMHSEVRQRGPGSCPICGMSLEPLQPTGDSDEDDELRDMTRRAIVGAAFTLPVIALAMGDMVLAGHPIDRLLGSTLSGWLELAFATPVVLWSAWPLLVRFVDSLRRRHLNMFTLIGIGVLVAYVYSVVATVAPAAFPSGFRDAHGGVALYFEAAATIVTLVLLGQVMELRARSSTGARFARCST